METYTQKILRLHAEDKKFLARWYINRWQTGGTRWNCFFLALRGVSFPYRDNVSKNREQQVNLWLLGYIPYA